MKRVITKLPIYAAYLMFITLMLLTTLAFSAEPMKEDFSDKTTVSGKVVGGEFIDGSGWRATTSTEASTGSAPNYIEYNISDFNDINEGTIEFWIQRSRTGGMVYNTGGSPETYDTVFELIGPDNSTVFDCMILWDYSKNENLSAISFVYLSDYDVVWGMDVPFEFKAAVGDWVHIGLTFGKNPEVDNVVYINGKKQRERPLPPSALNYNEFGLFGTYLSKADRLRIGIETANSASYPGGSSLLYHSILNNFIVHDRIITQFDLDRFLFSGKPTNLKAEYTEPEVTLTWIAAKSKDVVGYNVYKKNVNEENYVKLNSTLITDLTLNDAEIVDGKSYKYVVKGVNANGEESNASNEAALTIVSKFYRVTETSTNYDPTNLAGVFKDGKILITWGAPKGINPSGYNVYRRAGEGSAPFTKLNSAPVTGTSYNDGDVKAGSTYYYSATALNADGKEGKYPSEIKVEAANVAISSISIDPGRAVRTGEEVTITVLGTAGKDANFTIANLVDKVAMKESKSGTYYGTYIAGSESAENAAVIIRVGDAIRTASSTITIDNSAPSRINGLEIKNDWEKEINVSWQPSSDADFSKYNVYRSTNAITNLAGLTPYKVLDNKDVSELWDESVTPNMTYYYAVSAVDDAGNVGDISDVVSAKALADATLPVVYKIEESSAGVTLREGGVLDVNVEAESDCTVSFSIGSVVNNVPLAEDSRRGLYTGSYTIKSSDVVSDFIVVKLVDKSDNVSTYASDYKVSLDGSTKTDNTPPVIDTVSENSWSIAGFSGVLVAGDMLEVEMTGETDGVAYFEIGGVATKVKMEEADGVPGKYVGNYTVKVGDYAEKTSVTGYLADAAGNISTLTATSKFSVDTNVKIEVTPSKNVIPADSKTRVDVIAKVTDLNGDEVSGHKIKFTMATTDEYTGIVGGGEYSDFKDAVGGVLKTEWRGETDAFGEVGASYKAGFAAKTAMIIAKDLQTGNVGVGYVTAHVSSSIDITLTQPNVAARHLRTVGRGVYIQVTATPEKLTADGVSKSRIRAKVTDVRNQPVAGERIVFSMSSNNGKLVALDQKTDIRGVAEAEYTAGKEIGTVIITALDSDAGISGSTMIILMSDAPAKVYMTASTLTLPADGKSKSNISVKVSDINDNPNQGAVVEYSIVKGKGNLDTDVNETDRNGETENSYRASMTPGVVTIQARVTSRIPSEDELNRAKGTIFVGEVYTDFETGEIKEWYKEAGDDVTKGDALLKISTEVGEFVVTAKETGKLYSVKKYKRDKFAVGETLGIIEKQ